MSSTSLPPLQVPGLRSIAQLALGGLHTMALSHSGGVLCWGANQNGVLGQGHAKVQQSRRPEPVPGVSADQVRRSCPAVPALRGSGWAADPTYPCACLCWFYRQAAALLARQRSRQQAVSSWECEGAPSNPGPRADAQVSAGWKHCAAAYNGRLFTWGWGGSQGRLLREGGEGQ